MDYEVTEINFKTDGGLPIFLAAPTGGGTFPAVVFLHERYGLVRHTMDLATRLASAGYVVAAPDLYYQHPDQEALHRGEARIGRPSDRLMFQLLCDTVDALNARNDVEAGRLAMVGVCATGRYPIVYGADRALQVCVILHGAASAREWEVNEAFPEGLSSKLDRVKAPVLAMFAEKDHSISIDDVRELRNSLEVKDKTYEITIYEGAPHGWLNDTMPGRYRPEAAKSAWSQLLGFLSANLGEPPVTNSVSWSFSSVKARDYDFSKNERME